MSDRRDLWRGCYPEPRHVYGESLPGIVSGVIVKLCLGSFPSADRIDSSSCMTIRWL